MPHACSRLMTAKRLADAAKDRTAVTRAYHAQDVAVDFLDRDLAVGAKQIANRANIVRKIGHVGPLLHLDEIHELASACKRSGKDGGRRAASMESSISVVLSDADRKGKARRAHASEALLTVRIKQW